uniref:Chromo domain-containing protein n=1 Tax=Setaria digitata TaxID=48799 RepID=A0A915PXZ2_9BILA
MEQICGIAGSIDSPDDETNDMRIEFETSESSLSVTDDEATLPDGVFIVQKIVDHKCYGELRRKKLIDRRNVPHGSLFFRVHWKGFPGEDTWEPLQTVQHVDVLKKYARKHNLIHLISPSSSKTGIQNTTTDDESTEEEESENDEKRPSKKAKILANSESEMESDKILNRKRNRRKCSRTEYNTIKCSQRLSFKKTWWFRCKEKRNFDYPKLLDHKRKHLSCTSSYQGAKKLKDRFSRNFQKYKNEIPHRVIRKYIEMNSDGFIATTNRTRSVSPIIDKVLRKQQLYDVLDEKKFRDDQNFLKATKISTALAQSELAFVAKKLEESCVLRLHWMKIHNYNLRSPLQQIRNAKAYELDNILSRIIQESKNFEKQYFLLRKCLIEQDALEFLTQLQNMKRWCVATSESFDAVVYALFTANENISKFVEMLSSNCFAPKHHICGTDKRTRLHRHFFSILEISLSCFSLKYRAKLLERLNRETNDRLMDIVIGTGCSGGGFCILDALIKYGINVDYTEIHPLQQCILDGNEEAVSHLILSGFEMKRLNELPNDNIHEHAFKIMDSMNVYTDRLSLKIQSWTMTLLKEHSTKFTHSTDALPFSNICLHRIGQIDRNICLIISSEKSSSVANNQSLVSGFDFDYR